MGDIDKSLVEDYKNYLTEKTKLAVNSQVSYFNKFRAVIKIAFNEGLLSENYALRVKPIKEEETIREFLTISELQKLAKTECEIPLWKNAFLFASLTGLRFSDVQKIKWSDIQHDEHAGYFYRLNPKKTKAKHRVLPLAKIALKFMGEQKNDNSYVFPDLKPVFWSDKKLRKWISDAEITKKVTFHSSSYFCNNDANS